MTGYARRMAAYLSVRLPLPSHLLVAAMLQTGIAGFSHHLHAEAASVFSWPTALGVWCVFNMFLILRLMDDLKDAETDRRLFPDRPLPSGQVSETDLKLGLLAAIALYVGASILAGPAFWTGLVVLGYSLLMFRWFFIPSVMRSNLLLALATHAPIIPLIVLQGFVISLADHIGPLSELRWSLVLPFVTMIWAAIEGWEVSRKIRAPAEETEYVTYSHVLGSGGAVLLAALFQAVAVGCGLFLFHALDPSFLYLAVLAASSALAVWAHVRFVARPDLGSGGLGQIAGIFVLGLLAAQIVAFTGLFDRASS